jgi:hypothetical protein
LHLRIHRVQLLLGYLRLLLLLLLLWCRGL